MGGFYFDQDGNEVSKDQARVLRDPVRSFVLQTPLDGGGEVVTRHLVENHNDDPTGVPLIFETAVRLPGGLWVERALTATRAAAVATHDQTEALMRDYGFLPGTRRRARGLRRTLTLLCRW